MRYAICSAGVLLTLSCSECVLAQQSDPATANRALIGEGPNVEVRQSANATLDVGGPGAENPELTGENLRGNLGASSGEPIRGASPAKPNIGLPKYTFETPNFGPNLRGPSPGRKPTKEELRMVEDLILPRFRSALGGRTASIHGAHGWRYRYFNGRWWYWRANGSWAYWNGSQWRDRAARP